MRSCSGARSKRRMIDCISSVFGVSMNANPFDSCVSGFRITFTSSYTRFSALSQDLISSLVTQTGKFPRKTVKLILASRYSVLGDLARQLRGCDPRSYSILSHLSLSGKQKVYRNPMFTKENQYHLSGDSFPGTLQLARPSPLPLM